MPTNRTRRVRRRSADTEWQREFLVYGIRESDPPEVRRRPLVFMAECNGCFARSLVAREMWAEIKDAELARWIKERPGTRPYGWWEFDAPERVSCVDPVRTDPAKSAAYLAGHGLLAPGEQAALDL